MTGVRHGSAPQSAWIGSTVGMDAAWIGMDAAWIGAMDRLHSHHVKPSVCQTPRPRHGSEYYYNNNNTASIIMIIISQTPRPRQGSERVGQRLSVAYFLPRLLLPAASPPAGTRVTESSGNTKST